MSLIDHLSATKNRLIKLPSQMQNGLKCKCVSLSLLLNSFTERAFSMSFAEIYFSGICHKGLGTKSIYAPEINVQYHSHLSHQPGDKSQPDSSYRTCRSVVDNAHLTISLLAREDPNPDLVD